MLILKFVMTLNRQHFVVLQQIKEHGEFREINQQDIRYIKSFGHGSYEYVKNLIDTCV